jgi:hypothetical protein
MLRLPLNTLLLVSRAQTVALAPSVRSFHLGT